MQDVQGNSDLLADVGLQTTQPVISLQPSSICTAGMGGIQKPFAAGSLPQKEARWEVGLQQPLGPHFLGPGPSLSPVAEQLFGSGLRPALKPACGQPCHIGLQKPVVFGSEPWPSDGHTALQPISLYLLPLPRLSRLCSPVTRYG